MPKIQGYEDRVVAQGAMNAYADPSAFGSGIGAALQGFGAAVAGAGEEFEKVHEAQDVTEVHVRMAKARADWTQHLQDRGSQAVPGDETFATKLMEDMGTFFEKDVETVKTRRGREVYQSLAANMASEFGQRAIYRQSELAGTDAVNKYGSLVDALSRTTHADPTQLESVLANGVAAIEDPNGIFAKVPSPARDKFKEKLSQDVKFAAAKGFVRANPEAILQSLSPEDYAAFKPLESLLKTNASPGGKVQFSPAAMQEAPAVIAQATAHGVNPNVLLAQRDAGASEDVQAQSEDMAKLLDQYGGDYSKALAAYKMGPDAFNAVLQQSGTLWRDNVPTEVQGYLGAVLSKSGMEASEGPTEPAVPAVPAALGESVRSKLPFLDGLPYEHQEQIVQEAIQLTNMRLSIQAKARVEEKYLKDEQRNEAMTGFLNKIVEPHKYGGTSDDEILNDSVITWQQKQHLVDYRFTRLRESKALRGSENAGAVRDLLVRVHAKDGDPTKIYNMDPVEEALRKGGISTGQYVFLRNEVIALKDGDSNSFAQKVQSAREAVYNGTMRSTLGQIDPAKAINSWYLWQDDFNRKVAAKRAANEDPGVLLDPLSKEYVLAPERVQAFIQNPQAMLAAGAAKVVAMDGGRRTAGTSAPSLEAANQMQEGTVSKSGGFVWKNGNWEPK